MVCEKRTLADTKLGRYHDIIEYLNTNLETISLSDRFGFNRNIDISRQTNFVMPSYTGPGGLKKLRRNPGAWWLEKVKEKPWSQFPPCIALMPILMFQ